MLSPTDEQRQNTIYRVLNDEIVMPQFHKFCATCVETFETVRPNTAGENAAYIPELKNANTSDYGLSIVTVDGQVYSYGDAQKPFSIQSCHKPFNYALAIEEHGVDTVHEFIGTEPSGAGFNAFTLLLEMETFKPHNPMINAGAIVSASLIQNHLSMADRFDFIARQYASLAGKDKVDFLNTVYLSEMETSDRNHALVYLMKRHRVFRNHSLEQIQQHLQLYTQCCSLSVTCETLASMAATFANKGVNPMTHKRVVSQETAVYTLKQMFTSGMYDFSGEWAMTIGLPGKSGVAGAVYAIVPNVCAICVWSPRLDSHGNSARAVEFFQRLLARVPIGIFDQFFDSHHNRHIADNFASQGAVAEPMAAPLAHTVHEEEQSLADFLRRRRAVRLICKFVHRWLVRRRARKAAVLLKGTSSPETPTSDFLPHGSPAPAMSSLHSPSPSIGSVPTVTLSHSPSHTSLGKAYINAIGDAEHAAEVKYDGDTSAQERFESHGGGDEKTYSDMQALERKREQYTRLRSTFAVIRDTSDAGVTRAVVLNSGLARRPSTSHSRSDDGNNDADEESVARSDNSDSARSSRAAITSNPNSMSSSLNTTSMTRRLPYSSRFQSGGIAALLNTHSVAEDEESPHSNMSAAETAHAAAGRHK
jgi:glutaminase A